MTRPVDAAMDAERPEKTAIRTLWADAAEACHSRYPDAAPLYLTLSGAHGRDIELMAERGIFQRTEVGGVVAEDAAKICAVESSLEAVLTLRKKFPGLRVRHQPIQDLLRSTSPVIWPE